MARMGECSECKATTVVVGRGLCGTCYRRAQYYGFDANSTPVAPVDALPALTRLLSDGKAHTREEVCITTGVPYRQLPTLIKHAEKAGLLLYEDNGEIGLLTV